MKIIKYVFLFDSAISKVSSRFRIAPPSMGYVFVLYSILYIPSNCSQMAVVRHAKRMNYPISPASVSGAVHFFTSVGFVQVTDGKLSVTSLGREFLSAIRYYLLNKRL